MSTVTGILSDYDSDIDKYSNLALEKQLAATEAKKKAIEEPPISLQDALISAAIQLAPGFIGYLASGKSGAAIGLNSGLAGGQIYNQIVDKRNDAAQKQAQLDAEALGTEANQYQKMRDQLSGRLMGLNEKVALKDYSDKLIRGRDSNRGGIQATLLEALNQFGASKDASAEPTETPVIGPSDILSSDASQPTEPNQSFLPNSEGELAAFLQSPQGLEFAGQDIDEAAKTARFVNNLQAWRKGQLDIEGKQQDIKIGEQDIIQSKAETKKAEAEIQSIEDEQAATSRYKVMISDGLPLKYSGVQVVPNSSGLAFQGGKKETEKKMDEMAAMTAEYDGAVRQLREMSDILRSRNPAARFASADAKRLPEYLAETLARYNALLRSGTRAPNDKDKQSAQQMVNSMKIGGFWSNIGEQATAFPLEVIPSFQEEINTLLEELTTSLDGQLNNKFGFTLQIPEGGGVNNVQKFNNEGQTTTRPAAGPDGKQYIVTVDANDPNKVISYEEVTP